MKKHIMFLLMVLAAVLLLSACGTAANGENARFSTSTPAPTTEISSEEVAAYSDIPFVFKSEEDFLVVSKIANNKQDAISKNDAANFVDLMESSHIQASDAEDYRKDAQFTAVFDGLTYYYRLAAMPEYTSFREIWVKDAYVAYLYNIDPSASPDAYAEVNPIILSWTRHIYPDWTSKGMMNPKSYHHSIENQNITYTVLRFITKEATKDEEEVYAKGVYWDQDEYTFSGTVPDWFTDEDIKTYCRMEKVYIK